MTARLGVECPICMEELAASDLAALVTCGHVFCHNCVVQYLNSRRDSGNLKCPMCRALIRSNDQPLKLFISGGSPNTHTPSQPVLDNKASLSALRKELRAYKASSREQIRDLECRNDSLLNDVSRLESELSSDYHKTLASLQDFRQTIRTLTSATDSSWSEVARLTTENARLSGESEALGWRIEALHKSLNDALEHTLKMVRSPTRRSCEEGAEKLRVPKPRTDERVRDASRRIQDDEENCREVSKRWKNAQWATRDRIAEMRDQLLAAMTAAQRPRIQGWRPYGSNSELVDTLERTVCELEQLFASGDARPDQYKVGCYYRQRTWWPDDPERIHRNLLNRRDRSLSWW